MNHKNLLLILFFCLFLTPFVANGETVGGYFQIDVNVLRDGDNNPISLNNIALYIDEQPTYPDFFTGETIYEGYSYTSLYQELTVGQSYTLGFGNMGAKHVRANESLAGIMVRHTSGTNCASACAAIGFSCDDDAQRALAANMPSSEQSRLLGSGSVTANTAAPAWTNSNQCGDCRCGWGSRLIVPVADLTLISCASSGLTYAYAACRTGYRLCACGGWRIIVTI